MLPTTLRFSARTTQPAASRLGFSLIELLVVIAIIAVIIAITVPALSSARKSAKRAESAQLLADLAQGVAQFTLDEKRQPGYFSVQEMGDTENQTEGMSGMQNVMLDMMGGVVDSSATVTGTVVAVGPYSAANKKIKVDHAQIGRKQNNGNKLYWNLPAKVFEKTDPTTGEPIDQGLPSRIGNHKKIREIVDAFGAPVLAWAADETITTPVSSVDDFARIDYVAGSPSTKARVYWASNAAFLKSGVFVGSRQLNQAGTLGAEMPPATISMLHENVPALNRQQTLMGMLGNPGSPKNPAETDPELIFPTAPIAPLVFQSAGIDGYYLSRFDKGGKLSDIHSNQAVLDYGFNVKDKILEKFDDLIQAAN